ncbi:MAG: PIG-L deacetylase family protein [Chloroflexota bacterium]
MKRLLAILAHPDDESFGSGGTLSKYAREGVDVHICIATDGAAGSVEEGFEDARDDLVTVRAKELETAVDIIGATLHNLDYRDSGYINDPANEHPDAFIQCDETEAICKVVKLIRELKPDIVITHDETGGYFHPDHIQCWKITTPAFYAAADPEQFPELGLPPHQAERLYYSAFSNTWVKIFRGMARLRGQDPTKMGRNKDIDMTRLGMDPKKIHARIKYNPYWDIKMEASKAHASQGGGNFARRLPAWFQKRWLATESFMREYPKVPDGFRETDLFP